MPSSAEIPSLDEFLNAFHGAVAGRYWAEDNHDCSIYDHMAGLGAIHWKRMSERDRDCFTARYFDGASGIYLDRLIKRRFANFARSPLAARGIGTLTLSRANADAGAGTFPRGTRIELWVSGQSAPLTFRVRPAYDVGLSLSLSDVGIETLKEGASEAIDSDDLTVTSIRFIDPIWDPSWVISRVLCSAGTDAQLDPDYRAAVKDSRKNARLGFENTIIATCLAVASPPTTVFTVPWNAAGVAVDTGLNYVIVGNASGESTAALERACFLALSSISMGGACVQVVGRTSTALSLTVTLKFWKYPNDPLAQETLAKNAIVEYFAGRESPFLWSTSAIRGVVLQAVEGATSVAITPSLAEPSMATLFSAFPVPAYSIDAGDITVTITP